jgi:hypothetical protein
MNNIQVRAVRPDDVPQMADWLTRVPYTHVDPIMLSYRSTDVRVACAEDGPLVYMPVQRPLHMESIGTKPGVSKLAVAAALWALFQDAIALAKAEGRGEIYFMGTEATVPALATEHGFEKLPYTVYRYRVPLEPPCQT